MSRLPFICDKCGFDLEISPRHNCEKEMNKETKVENNHVTIELTDKKIKRMKVYAWTFTFIGIWLLTFEFLGSKDVGKMLFDGLIIFIGYIILLFSRFKTWWNHK